MSTYAIVVAIAILLLVVPIFLIIYAIKNKKWFAVIILLLFGGLNYFATIYSNQAASNYLYLFRIMSIISWIGMGYSGYLIFKK